MNHDQINKKIDDFLKGKLSDEEMALFEMEMAKDEHLKAEVDLYRAEHEVMNQLVKEKLHGNMAKWDLELQQETVASKPRGILFLKNRRQVLAVAATVAVLLVAAFWVLSGDGTSAASSETVALTEKATLRIPLFSNEDQGLGFAGPNEAIDSVQVMIYEDQAHPFHYRFKQDLHLFFSPEYDFTNLQLSLDHAPSEDHYFLSLKGEKYVLDRGFNNIYELKSID